MSWDFSKLPRSEYKEVIKLHRVSDIKGLLKIHDKYRLSNYSYSESDLLKCCSATHVGVMQYFGKEINDGRIN